MDMNTRVRIGIAGLGRSGWRNHLLPLLELQDRFHVVAVTDPDESRRQEAATHGCRGHASFEQLLGDDQVEVVVVATPSHLHAQHTIQALQAGKHVVCEKPMACSLAEVDSMIAAAQHAGRLLTVFQNRRFFQDFLQVRRIIDSGVLGRLVQVRIAVHGFGRRWDWQTLAALGGGELNNTATHFLDQALQLIDADTPLEVFCHRDRTLTCGDAEDHVTLLVKPQSGPLLQVEVSSACACGQERWLIFGTRGGLAGSDTALRWRVSNVDQMPPRQASASPTADRSYNRETLAWSEHQWAAPADAPSDKRLYYQALFETIRLGLPPAVTAMSVRRQMDVVERCRQAPLPAAAQAATTPA
jgi:predicted dehydrogenase